MHIKFVIYYYNSYYNYRRPAVLHIGDIRIQADIGQNALGLQTPKKTKEGGPPANAQGMCQQ